MLNAEREQSAEYESTLDLITLMARALITSRFFGAPSKVIKVIRDLVSMLITLKNFPHGPGTKTEVGAGRVAKLQWDQVARWGTPRMGRAIRMP